MLTNRPTEASFLVRHRYWMMAASAILFLPPLSYLFQLTGDHNFCGTWCPKMFMIWREGMTLDQYFAGWSRAYMGVGLVFGMLVTTLLLGRYWCSHVCPVGGITELGSRLVPQSLKIDFSRIPASPFRYGFLAVYFAAPLLGIGNLCCRYCNFAAIPRLFGAAFSEADMVYFLRTAGLINLALLAALGFFALGGRAYCNLLCPLGALDALSNRLGFRFGKRMRVEAANCNGCGDCATVCPTWSIDVNGSAAIDPLSCMPCRICETACPGEAIHYGRSQE